MAPVRWSKGGDNRLVEGVVIAPEHANLLQRQREGEGERERDQQDSGFGIQRCSPCPPLPHPGDLWPRLRGQKVQPRELKERKSQQPIDRGKKIENSPLALMQPPRSSPLQPRHSKHLISLAALLAAPA